MTEGVGEELSDTNEHVHTHTLSHYPKVALGPYSGTYPIGLDH
jgi:hypothetical protein